jgi:hypothetical protein
MPVSLANIMIITTTLALAVVASVLAMRVVRWRRDIALRHHGAPRLVVPITGVETAARPQFLREVAQIRAAPAVASQVTTAEEPAPPDEHPPDIELVSDAHPAWRDGPADLPRSRQLRAHVSVVEGSNVRFFRAEEGTLEFLPGRLEVVGGDDAGQEIHFARPVGEEDASITFGRSDGPALRHVQLLDPTVSRHHARMSFDGRRWHLRNLSRTNPVTLNGVPLPDHGSGITLEAGDRLEMGAVVFVFHDR